MTATDEVRTAGDRVEALLGELGELTDAATLDRIDELVRVLVGLYGAGLDRVMEIITAAGDTEALRRLAADELVSALLVLHDLHPLSTAERVRAALDEVRPYLGLHDGGVELVDITVDGVARLRLQGTCHGCPSSRNTVTDAIERAITRAAPEITKVDAEGLVDAVVPRRPGGTEPQLLQIGRRPPGPCPVPEGETR
jgi:Fe-S cluster biogenesis protein NfuA